MDSKPDDTNIEIISKTEENSSPILIDNGNVEPNNVTEIQNTSQFSKTESDYMQEHEQDMLETFNAIIESETQNIMPEDKSDYTESTTFRESDNIVSEIMYNYPVEVLESNEKEDTGFCEKRTEYAEVSDEVIYPLPSGAGSPRRIPDLDTRKEPSVVYMSAFENTGDLSLGHEEDVLQYYPELVEEEEEVVEKEPEVVVREKEEFILTLDDLTNVDFGVPRKPKPVVALIAEEQVDEVHAAETQMYEYEENEFRQDEEYRPDTNFTPYKDSDEEGNNGVNDSVLGFKGSVKNRCTEISFLPRTESEMEHVLEEKSISMIALPAMRVKRSNELPTYTTYSSSAKFVLSDVSDKNNANYYNLSSSPNSNPNDYIDGYSPSSQSSDKPQLIYEQNIVENGDNDIDFEQSQLDEQQETLRVQYEQLQSQMAQWQAQLEENQELLESQNMDPVDREIQLQQIQMYRDMMYQLQQNIEALNIQQQQLKEQQSAISPDRPMVSRIENVEDSVTSPSVPLMQEVVQNAEAEIPVAPPPPSTLQPRYSEKVQRNASPTVMNNSLLFPKPYKAPQEKVKAKPMRKFEPKLDPREELMIAVRNYGGWSGLKRVKMELKLFFFASIVRQKTTVISAN